MESLREDEEEDEAAEEVEDPDCLIASKSAAGWDDRSPTLSCVLEVEET